MRAKVLNLETWYERFEYPENPFSVKPKLSAFVNLKDMTMQLIQGLASDDFILLSGDVGSGKTTILLFLKENITTPLTPVYHNCVDSKEFDLGKILEKRNSFWDRLFRRKYGRGDNVLLFLDECQLLKEKDLEQIKAYYDSGELKSVVLCSSDLNFINESIRDRVSVDLRVRSLTKEETAELIRRRVGDHVNPFTLEAMHLIGEASSYNPRGILKNCERVLTALFARNETPAYVTPEHVSGILNVEYVKPAPQMMERKRTIEEVTRIPVAEITIVDDKPGDIASIEMQSAFEVPVATERKVKVKQEYKLPEELDKLSPLQKSIIVSLSNGGKSYNELCQELNKSRDTIAKQVSRLCLLSDKKLMKKRGIKKPVLQKNRESGQILLELSPHVQTKMGVKK